MPECHENTRAAGFPGTGCPLACDAACKSPFAGDAVAAVDRECFGDARGRAPATRALGAPNTSPAIFGSRKPAACELATACARHRAGLASAAAIVSMT